MNPSEINWTAFEDAVLEVIGQCLQYLTQNPPAAPVYAFGVEGLVEQGVVSVGANTTDARVPDAEWWMPDWSLAHLDESLSIDPVSTLLKPFAESIGEIDFGTNPEEIYQDLIRRFRLGCLRALRRSEPGIGNYDFARTPEFILMYMDSDDGFYHGLNDIENGIKSLA